MVENKPNNLPPHIEPEVNENAYPSFKAWRKMGLIHPGSTFAEIAERSVNYTRIFLGQTNNSELARERRKRLSQAGKRARDWHIINAFYQPQPLEDGDQFATEEEKNKALIAATLPQGLEVFTTPSIQKKKLPDGQVEIVEIPNHWEVYVRESPTPQS